MQCKIWLCLFGGQKERKKSTIHNLLYSLAMLCGALVGVFKEPGLEAPTTRPGKWSSVLALGINLTPCARPETQKLIKTLH